MNTAMDVLSKRSFVRLRIGVGGRERRQLARQIEAWLDCVVVHEVGHTLSLYRTLGLARPVGTSCSSAAAAPAALEE